MDEEIAIIDELTRREKITNFLIKNKKKVYLVLILILVTLFLIFYLSDVKEKKKIELSNIFINASINYTAENKNDYLNIFKNIIEKNDSTYSPLALFFIIDNKLLVSNEEINPLIDRVIKNSRLENEIKNLIIYKKALINFEFVNEKDLIEILNPIINSESIWKPHALLLLGDYFLSKDEKNKAQESFNRILIIKNGDENILFQAQTRLRNINE